MSKFWQDVVAKSSKDPAGIPGDLRIPLSEWSKLQAELIQLKALKTEAVKLYREDLTEDPDAHWPNCHWRPGEDLDCDCDLVARMTAKYPVIAAAAKDQIKKEI